MAMPRLGAAMAVGAALDEAKDASEAAAAFLHRASAFRCVRHHHNASVMSF